MRKTRYSLADLRRDMAIKLTVMPRHVFKELWDPKVSGKDRLRDQVVATLTAGWERYEVFRGQPDGMHTAGGRPYDLPEPACSDDDEPT